MRHGFFSLLKNLSVVGDWVYVSEHNRTDGGWKRREKADSNCLIIYRVLLLFPKFTRKHMQHLAAGTFGEIFAHSRVTFLL